MTNIETFSDDSELEAMIRGAGEFVQPSIDLRPRVLEAARGACRERGLQRVSMALVALVLFAATLSETWRLQSWGFGRSRRLEGAASLRSPVVFRAAPMWAAGGMQASVESRSPMSDEWNLVESFTEMRRRQARVLRLDL